MATLKAVAISTTIVCVLIVSAPGPSARAADGNVTLGGQWWTQTAKEAKFQEFREVPQGAFTESFLLQEWSGRTSLAVWGSNSIRNDQASRLTLAHGVRWRADLGYAEIPHTFGFTARSPWAQTSPGSFTIPDLIQSANQTTPANYTNNMKEVLSNAPNIPLGFRTGTSTVRLRSRPAQGWQFEARGARRQRTGQKAYATSFGFSTAIEIPEPIEQNMYEADLTGNYRRQRLTAQVGLGLSTFENKISTLFVDNPKRVADVIGGDGARIGALDLYPDNRQVRGTVALGYQLASHTSLAGTLGLSQTEQDDDLLPLTNNKLLPQSSRDSLPASSADAKAILMNGDVRLVTRPVEGLSGALRFRYADYDNQTPERNFIGRVPYDASFQRYIELENKAYSNRNWSAGVDADYLVMSRAKIGGTFEYRVTDRTHREVEESVESTYGARARIWPVDGLTVNARYSRADRSFDEFHDSDYYGYKTRTAVGSTPAYYDSLGQIEQLALRRFDVANRIADRANGEISYAFGDRMDVSVGYSYVRNDYPDSELGLEDDTDQNVACTGTYHVNEALDLDGSYGFGRSETNQNSRQSSTSTPSPSPANNWNANLTDTDVYVGAGINWVPPIQKVTLAANYQFSRHFAEFDLGNAAGTALDVPSTIYRLHDVVVDTRYRWLEGLTLIGRYGWEQYDVNDWATNNVPAIFPQTGTSNAIFLGDSAQSYRVHRIALMATCTF